VILEEARDTLLALGRGLPDRGGKIVLHTDGPVARLVITNPGARNAFTVAMMASLADALIALSRWDGAVLHVLGEGGVFCSGGHLDDVQDALIEGASGRAMSDAMTALLDGLRAMPFVSIAVIDGPALGGGAELTTACDLRACGARGYVHFVHGALGVAPGWGGAGRLVEVVGRTEALRILTSAAKVGPDAGRAIGLFDAIAEDALTAAQALTTPILALPAVAVRAMKAQVCASDRDEESAAFASVWGGPAHRAALARRGR
jgi:ethylmalonyl-CoA/methylmalonyl-CoA decarboxylase